MQLTGRSLPALADKLNSHREHAISVRHPSEALECHTIRQLVMRHGPGLVGIEVAALTKQAMEYFAPGRRMTPGQITLFADELVQRYPHENMPDVALFLRGAAVGQYGDGETFGALDPQRLFVWFRQYLDEKATARERVAEKQEAEAKVGALKLLEAVPQIADAVKMANADNVTRRNEAEERRRLAHLTKYTPHMDDDQLREAWKTYTRAPERSIILQAAKKRGLLKDHDGENC